MDRSYNLDRNIVSVKAYQIDKAALALEEKKAEEARKAIEEANTISEEGFIVTQLSQVSRRRSFTERLKDKKERKEQELEKQNNKIQTLEDTNKNKLNVIDQRFSYNPDGTLKSAYTGNMQYEYAYNIEGRLESKSASGKTLLRYAYDKNNNIKSIKDITGKSSIYSYDEADRVKLIQDDNKNNLAIYDYYKNDSIKSVTVGNGLKTNYTYDGDGNVQSLVTISSNGEVLVDYNYAYDLNGNRLQKVSSKHKNFYTYDSMNRLKEASYDERKESFTYDKVGNRLTKTTNDITEKYVYNVKNQLKELHNNSGINHFTYDKQGNTIKEETTTGNNIFEYNTLNQQVKAITKEGNTLVSRYDTEGLRAEIEENEKLTKFIFHKDNVLVEADKEYNAISRFTRGYEVVAADVADSEEILNLEVKSKLNRYYYTVDEQGSTIFITDKNHRIKNEYYYDAFGCVLNSKEEIHNRITYTGQQYDSITQQYYLRARFYNPVIGRFTQEDIYRGDGLNLYAYCGNNPVSYYDTSGFARSPKLTRSTVAKGDTVNAIQDALNGINIGEQGDGFVILKDKLPLDKKAIAVLKKNGLDGIWYRNGRPDFIPVSLFNVQIPNMTTERRGIGGNFDQTRNAIAEAIIEHNGNINSLMKAGVVSDYATANTKKTVFNFLKNDAKSILESDSSYSEKVKELNKSIYDKFQDVDESKFTIHEVNTKDVQLVPYEINARYNHDGGVSDCGKNESITNKCMKK